MPELGNPPAAVAERREDGPARLEVFTVEQIEALARAAERGAWPGPHDDLTDAGELVRAEEDAGLAELLRVAAYTGLRCGELVALRWRDVRWSERGLVVERALSGDVESTTKGRRIRYVPLGDQALGALDRLSRRDNFTSDRVGTAPPRLWSVPDLVPPRGGIRCRSALVGAAIKR